MMKSLLSAIIISFLLYNCSKISEKEKNTMQELPAQVKKEMLIDSLSISDSMAFGKTLSAEFSSGVLLFPAGLDKSLLDSIYAKENISLKNYDKTSLDQELVKKKDAYFSGVKRDLSNYTPDFKQTWNETATMKVFRKKDHLLTIQYSGDGFSGGAHGYYYEFYKNFNLKNNFTYQLSDVFLTQDAKIWSALIMKYFLRTYEQELLFEQTIPLTANFYFDEKEIVFVYNQYEIAPYSSGVIAIQIPLSEISAQLKPEFKKEMKIN